MTLRGKLVGASFLVWMVALSGCQNGDLPAFEGRYEGQQLLRGQIHQVIAEVPRFKVIEQARVLEFKVFQTLASADGQSVKISFSAADSVSMSFPSVLPSESVLVRSGDCANGSDGALTLKLCWTQDKIDFEVTQAGPDPKVYEIHLAQDDKLPAPPSGSSSEHDYTLDEVLGRAKFLSYSVAQDAEKVFQAKSSIQVAEGNLLPHLNVGSILGLALGERSSAFQAIGNLLPFVFPSNWYRLKETKALYQAELVSFSSLRGNEMNIAEGLYYAVERDKASLALLSSHITWLKKIQESLKKEEESGVLTIGTAAFFGASISRLEQDQIALEGFVRSELASLSQAVALPPIGGVSSLAAIPEPDFGALRLIDPSTFVKEATEKSFELKTFDFLAEASRNAQREVTFGFLDPSGDASIGFGMASSIRIARSQTEVIRQKAAELSSLIQQRSSDVANDYNSSLRSIGVVASEIARLTERLDWLMTRHIGGDSTLDESDFIDQLLDLQGRILASKADRLSYVRNWRIANSKLDRLLLQGFYSKLQPEVTSKNSDSDSGRGRNQL